MFQEFFQQEYFDSLKGTVETCTEIQSLFCEMICNNGYADLLHSFSTQYSFMNTEFRIRYHYNELKDLENLISCE